ncbi:flagellar assembly protein FliH [Microbulbifer aggregans]|uniref:flagellar assembly protein FliH n=1 Tax=Microbulbifer aggregans TaxID=1769779 RepID=UPI001CFC5F1B|nr:flagellar assembly protein FliH [Microbulbifer aggregans]
MSETTIPEAATANESDGITWRRWQPDDLTGNRARERRESAQRTLTEELKILREQARAEGLREGYDAGFTEGYEKGEQEGRTAGLAETEQQRDALLAPLAELARNFSDALASLDSDIAEDISALAIAVGRQLADDALQAQPQQVAELVRSLLRDEPTLNGGTRLWLHPDDLVLVQQVLSAELEGAGWRLDQDPRIARGGCRVTTASGEIDASRDTRWQALLSRVGPANNNSGAPQ